MSCLCGRVLADINKAQEIIAKASQRREPMNTKSLDEVLQDIIDALKILDRKDRLRFFDLLSEEFCPHCGKQQPTSLDLSGCRRSCQCMNDE